MKQGTAWLAIILMLVFVVSGCGPTAQETSAYYTQLGKQTEAIIATIERQGAENKINRIQMMRHYSDSMNAASMTQVVSDDAVVAFAWGYQMGQPTKIEIPNLPKIAAPETSSEKVRAWTPIVGMAVPFLYPLAYGYASGDGGTTIKADNGSRVVVDSQNAGSYNKAGGAQSIDTTQTNDNGTCDDCDEDSGLEVNPVDVDPEDPEEAPASCGTSGGWYNNGTWWLSEGSTCSCASREAGRC